MLLLVIYSRHCKQPVSYTHLSKHTAWCLSYLIYLFKSGCVRVLHCHQDFTLLPSYHQFFDMVVGPKPNKSKSHIARARTRVLYITVLAVSGCTLLRI